MKHAVRVVVRRKTTTTALLPEIRGKRVVVRGRKKENEVYPDTSVAREQSCAREPRTSTASEMRTTVRLRSCVIERDMPCRAYVVRYCFIESRGYREWVDTVVDRHMDFFIADEVVRQAGDPVSAIGDMASTRVRHALVAEYAEALSETEIEAVLAETVVATMVAFRRDQPGALARY